MSDGAKVDVGGIDDQQAIGQRSGAPGVEQIEALENVDHVTLAVEDDHGRNVVGITLQILDNQMLEELRLTVSGASEHVHVLEARLLGDVDGDRGGEDIEKRRAVEIDPGQLWLRLAGFRRQDQRLLRGGAVFVANAAGGEEVVVDGADQRLEQAMLVVALRHDGEEQVVQRLCRLRQAVDDSHRQIERAASLRIGLEHAVWQVLEQRHPHVDEALGPKIDDVGRIEQKVALALQIVAQGDAVLQAERHVPIDGGKAEEDFLRQQRRRRCRRPDR